MASGHVINVLDMNWLFYHSFHSKEPWFSLSLSVFSWKTLSLLLCPPYLWLVAVIPWVLYRCPYHFPTQWTSNILWSIYYFPLIHFYRRENKSQFEWWDLDVQSFTKCMGKIWGLNQKESWIGSLKEPTSSLQIIFREIQCSHSL